MLALSTFAFSKTPQLNKKMVLNQQESWCPRVACPEICLSSTYRIPPFCEISLHHAFVMLHAADHNPDTKTKSSSIQNFYSLLFIFDHLTFPRLFTSSEGISNEINKAKF